MANEIYVFVNMMYKIEGGIEVSQLGKFSGNRNQLCQTQEWHQKYPKSPYHSLVSKFA